MDYIILLGREIFGGPMNLSVTTENLSAMRWFFFMMATGFMVLSWVMLPILFRGISLGLFMVQMVPMGIQRTHYVDWIWSAFVFSFFGAIFSLVIAEFLFRLKHTDKVIKKAHAEDPEHVKSRSIQDQMSPHRNPAYRHLFPKDKPR